MTYTCKPPFKLRGSSKRTCRATGKWDGKKARCSEYLYEIRTLFKSNTFVLIGRKESIIDVTLNMTFHKSLLEYLLMFFPSLLCSFVFFYDPSMLLCFYPPLLRCFVSSLLCSFVRSFINFRYRLGIMCKDPGEITFGNRRVEGLQPGKYIQYWCFDYYNLTGSVERSVRIKCLETGEWSAPKPKCECTY